MFVILFILIPFSNGYKNYVDMAISFYEESHVTSLCLLMCDDYESNFLAKNAVSQNLVVSMVNIDELAEDFSKFDACLTQRISIGVLLNSKCKAYEKVINYASKNFMLNSKRKWLIVDDTLNTDDLIEKINEKNLKDNVNITDIKYTESNVELNINTPEDIELIYNDKEDKKKNTTCNEDNYIAFSNTSAEDYLESLDDTKINIKYTNINTEDPSLLNYDLQEFKILVFLSKMNISVDADITIAIRTDSNTYDFYEIINYGKIQGGSLVAKKIYDGIRDLKINKQYYTYYKRWNFNELELNMIVVMSPIPEVFDPQMILGRIRDKRAAVVVQTGAQMLHIIAEIHNIKFRYTLVDRWVGNFQRNRTYPIMCALLLGLKLAFPFDYITYAVTNALYFREADITPIIRYVPAFIGKLDITSTPLSNIETRFYYRIPSSGPGKFENQFLTPLSPGAWCGVVGVCSICGVVLLISSQFEQRPYSLPYSFFSVFALICQQFFEDTDEKGIKRSSTARKITILVTGICCVLVYNYYTSSVVSWLLNGPPPSINSLWELINSPLQPIFEDIGYTQSWLTLPNYYYNKRNSEAEDKLKQKMFKHMKKMSIFRTVDDGIELVKRGGYAYHTEVNGANEIISRTFDQRELCDMGSLQSMEKTVLFAAVQQNSPYKEFFDWSLMRLNERGIISCIRNRISSQEPKCDGSSPRALALGGAAPAFILLACGYVLGTVIMLLERYIYYRTPYFISKLFV